MIKIINSANEPKLKMDNTVKWALRRCRIGCQRLVWKERWHGATTSESTTGEWNFRERKYQNICWNGSWMITCALASRDFKQYSMIHVLHHFPSIERTDISSFKRYLFFFFFFLMKPSRCVLVRQTQPIQPLMSSEIPVVILKWPESQRWPLPLHRHLDKPVLELRRNINLVT